MNSLVESRMKEFAEYSHFKTNNEVREKNKNVQDVYKKLVQLIPENIKEAFMIVFDNYILENDKMYWLIENEAYKQGIKDGFEIKKILDEKR